MNTSISRSTLTNGPWKQLGGGSRVHRCAAAGGYGNVPPGTGCSPGCAFTFGLYGIICDVSGRGSGESSSLSIIEASAPDFVTLITSVYPMLFNSAGVHG